VAVHQVALSQQQHQQQQQPGAGGDGAGPGANGTANTVLQATAPAPSSSQEVGTQMDPVAASVGPDQHQVKDEVKPAVVGCAKDVRNLAMPG
jgi:hypothetical protein